MPVFLVYVGTDFSCRHGISKFDIIFCVGMSLVWFGASSCIVFFELYNAIGSISILLFWRGSVCFLLGWYDIIMLWFRLVQYQSKHDDKMISLFFLVYTGTRLSS